MLFNPIKLFFIPLFLLITIKDAEAISTTDSIPLLTEDSITKDPSGTSILESRVKYTATDSIRFEIASQKVFLYGDADVVYEDIHLKAAYIELDLKNNIVVSTGLEDTLGKIAGNPVFTNEGQTFDATKITYNFKTKKGKIAEVKTKESEGYIHGETVKKDSNNVYYIRNGKYTTCDLGHPHFYIGTTKLKVIPNDKIITGPAYLVIEDIPTPLAVPFGFFPNSRGRSSGILIPTYGESPNLGFFLKDGGYYFGLSDYVDLAVRGDIYSMGSWGLKTLSSYKKRYKYNGNLNLSYSKIITGDPELPNSKKQSDFFVRWSHTQDPKARPNSRFSANVNAGSSNYNTYNSHNTADYLSNTFQSNISYSKSFAGKPLNLSVNARHSQNTITKRVDLSLPEITFSVNRLYPFKKKSRIEPKWYDKIGISEVTNARNSISTYDSLLFTANALQQMQNGISNVIPISTSFNVLKYFTFTPSLTASSNWYFQTIRKQYDTTANALVVDTVQGFKPTFDYSVSGNLNTRLYGTYQFKHSNVKAIRHVMTPNIGFSYRPDFSTEKWGYYKTVQADSLGRNAKYSVFEKGIYGSPASGKSGLVNWSLDNNVEMKVKSKNDSSITNKKVVLIQSLSISSSYNMAIENYKWSVININGRTRLFKNLDVNLNTTFDPYSMDSLGNRIEKFEWREHQKLGRLTAATLSLGTNLKTSNDGNKKKQSTKGAEDELDYINAHPDAYVDFNIPWSLNVYYNLRYSKPGLKEEITQSLTFNGDVNLTKKWKIGFNSGYDFIQKDFTYTSVNVYRDLHCWEMAFNWVPFGFRQSYSLDIKVKSAVLQDLKLSRKRDWYDYK